MKLPFVSREHHEEVTALLRQQIAELDELNKRLMDRVATRAIGEPIWDRADRPVATRPAPATELERAAKLVGSTQPSLLARGVTALRLRAHHQKNYPTGKATATDVVAGLTEAVSEGQRLAEVKQ